MLERIGRLSGKLQGWCREAARVGTLATGAVAGEALRSLRGGLFVTSHFIDGELLPALSSVSEMGSDIQSSWLDTLAGRKTLYAHLEELSERTLSASKYERLVQTMGGELFGSARYAGEERLLETDVFRLSYVPPKAGGAGQPPAYFQLGGFIPYGDRIFRFLPEANLYDRFLERGMPVYLMELKGDRHDMTDIGEITLEKFIDTVEDMATVAWRHNQRRKMIAGAYCGTGLQLLAYLAARPRDAELKFDTAAMFVSPVDGRKCQIMSELIANLPRSFFSTTFARIKLLGGVLPGVEMWAGLDLTLKATFIKTSFGRFTAGWKNRAWAPIREVKDLSPQQRFELAGAYWISVPNADRFPMPIDLVKLAVASYDGGIKDDGDLHAKYRGQPINLRAIAEATSLRLTGIYGAQDKIVQEETGHVLKRILGDRYAHHVNANAAHVSYVCVPVQWLPGHAASFAPNPIDAILQQHAAKPAQRPTHPQAQAQA
jgi:hypothetical protein